MFVSAQFVLGAAVLPDVEFAAQVQHYRAVERQTNEPSSGGTFLRVYLDGRNAKKLFYKIETGGRYIHRHYYFSHGQLGLVVETIWRLDRGGGFSAEAAPQHSRLWMLTGEASAGTGETSPSVARRRELIAHAESLLKFYHDHARSFHPMPNHDGAKDRPQSGHILR